MDRRGAGDEALLIGSGGKSKVAAGSSLPVSSCIIELITSSSDFRFCDEGISCSLVGDSLLGCSLVGGRTIGTFVVGDNSMGLLAGVDGVIGVMIAGW